MLNVNKAHPAHAWYAICYRGMRLHWRKNTLRRRINSISYSVLCISCHVIIFLSASGFLCRFDIQPFLNTRRQTSQLPPYCISGAGQLYCSSNWKYGANKSQLLLELMMLDSCRKKHKSLLPFQGSLYPGLQILNWSASYFLLVLFFLIRWWRVAKAHH